MTVAFRVVIPARFASSRLPGKPLLDIGGQPMLRHVYARAVASGAAEVVVATDDERIAEAAGSFGALACMTSQGHRSGTDRVAEVARRLAWKDQEVVVNLQGDEPLMPPAVIRQLSEVLAARPQTSAATLCEPIRAATELFDPHVVKVVRNAEGNALYFSRAPIPWHRDAFVDGRTVLPAKSPYFRHVGLYAFRVDFLREYVRWPACELEQAESLEQLRILWQGHAIHVAAAAEHIPAGVDTPEDLERVRAVFNRRGGGGVM